MNEPHKNALCPCESGKKYLECCFPRHLEISRGKRVVEDMEEINKELAEMDFASREELNAYLLRRSGRRNAEPRADFLGLSPEQIRRFIDFGFPPPSELVVFRTDIPALDLTGIPAVHGATRFLRDMAASGPLKATERGYLPKEFAKRLFEDLDHSHVKPFIKFRSEADSMTVEILRLLLTGEKWIKKEKKIFRLTRKGERVAENGFTGQDYLDLLSTYAHNINWAAMDGYPEFGIIQHGLLFSLYLLHRKAGQFIESYSLSPYFIRAFPMVLREAPDHEWTDEFSNVDRCWTLRFLERFCLYFGLVQLEGGEPGPLDRTMILKTTPFFDRFIGWRTGKPAVH
jgi:hypothetical protein